MVRVDLSSTGTSGSFGRPLEATIEVWNAAGNSPVTPLRATNSLQLQNRAQLKAERSWAMDGLVGTVVTENAKIVEGALPRATEQLWIAICFLSS